MRTTTISGRTVLAKRNPAKGRNSLIPAAYADRAEAVDMAARLTASNAPCVPIEIGGLIFLEVVSD